MKIYIIRWGLNFDIKDIYGFVDVVWIVLLGFGGIKWFFKDVLKRYINVF